MSPGRWLAAYGGTLVALGLATSSPCSSWSPTRSRCLVPPRVPARPGFVLRWAAAVAAALILVSPVPWSATASCTRSAGSEPPSVYSLLSVGGWSVTRCCSSSCWPSWPARWCQPEAGLHGAGQHEEEQHGAGQHGG